MARVTKPIALDRSFNTTEQASRNIADVLAEELSAIITALGGLNFINYEVVEELPTTGISTTTIYLVPSDDPQSGNTYDEYINLNGTVSGWEKIGSTAIDLSGYYTSDETDALLDEKVDKDSFDEQTATDEFSTINGGLLSECKVALSPNQDLHGYDHPWVGGAGKNKLEDTFNTGTLNSVVITSTGGIIDLNGTGTDANNFAIKSRTPNGEYIYLPKGNYIFSAEGIGSGVVVGTTYNGAFYEIARNDGGESAGFSITDNTPSDYKLSDGSVLVGLFINIKAQTYSHQKVYPMIRLATESDPTFEPYSNICPITGHTQSKVQNHQKNLCDNSANIIGLWESDGIYHDNSSYRTSDLIEVSANTEYSVSLFDLSTNTRVNGLVVTEWDANSEIIGQVDGNTLTTTANTKYVRIRNYGANSELVKTSNYAYQLELGSTATPYVPYNGYQVTVNLGGTYYSGTLDVVTGVFVPDTAGVDLGTLTWTYEQWGAGWDFWTFVNGIKPASSYDEITTAITEQYKPVSRNTMYNNSTDGIMAVMTGGGAVKIRDNRYSDAASFTSAVSGVKMVYPLATPTPIQFSPTIVKALVGENHLSAPLDGQEITESKYRELFTWDEVEAYVNAHSGGGSGMNYSTEEQVVGTYLGKPLYAKTIVYTPSGTISSNTTIANIPNAKVMRVTEATAYNSSENRGYTLPDVRANGGTKITYDNGDVVLEIISDSWSSSWTFHVTVQYTKTTD